MPNILKKINAFISNTFKINTSSEATENSSSEKSASYPFAQNYKSGGAKFKGALNPVGLEYFNRNELRARSRQTLFESPIYKSMIFWLIAYTVGSGLDVEPSPDWDILKIASETKRRDIRKKIEQRFRLIMSSRHLDSTNRTNGYKMQRDIFEQYLIDGEVFVLLNYDHNSNKITPVNLRIIPAESVCNYSNKNKTFIDGIKLNENGIPTAYNIANYIRDSSSASVNHKSFEYVEIPATQEVQNGLDLVRIVHFANRNRPSDLRGIPVATHILHEFENIYTAIIAELEAQKLNASVFAVVNRSSETPASGGILAASQFGKQQNTTETNPPTLDWFDAPGIVVNSLKAGESLSSLATDRPNINIPAFIAEVLKPMTSSVGIPAEVLYGLFSNNYSASRAAIQQFITAIKQYRSEFVDAVLSPIYQSVITELVYAGELKLDGFLDDALKREAWLKHHFNGSTPPSLDPSADIEAYALAISHGFVTHEKACRELYGTNFFENIEALKTEMKAKQKLQQDTVQNNSEIENKKETTADKDKADKDGQDE